MARKLIVSDDAAKRIVRNGTPQVWYDRQVIHAPKRGFVEKKFDDKNFFIIEYTQHPWCGHPAHIGDVTYISDPDIYGMPFNTPSEVVMYLEKHKISFLGSHYQLVPNASDFPCVGLSNINANDHRTVAYAIAPGPVYVAWIDMSDIPQDADLKQYRFAIPNNDDVPGHELVTLKASNIAGSATWYIIEFPVGDYYNPVFWANDICCLCVVMGLAPQFFNGHLLGRVESSCNATGEIPVIAENGQSYVCSSPLSKGDDVFDANQKVLIQHNMNSGGWEIINAACPSED